MALVVQWYNSRLPRGRPGFDSRPEQPFFHFAHFYSILCDLKHFIISMFLACGTGGSVVEFLLSTQEDWVLFPASATFFHFIHFYNILCDLKHFINRCFTRVALVVQW